MSYNGVRPSADFYTLGRGDAELQRKGTTFLTPIGEAESIKLKPEFQEIERFSKAYGRKTSVRKDIIQVGGTIEAVLMQRVPMVREMIYQGLSKPRVQNAIAENTDDFGTVPAGAKVDLGARDVTVTSVKIGGVALPAQSYRVDPEVGTVQTLVAGVLTVTWSAASGTRDKIGGFSIDGLEGRFRFRGTNAIGIPELVDVWDTTFKLSSDVDLVGGDEYDPVTVAGTMRPDLSQLDPDDALFVVEQILNR